MNDLNDKLNEAQAQNKMLVSALQAFVDQATKLSGFPAQYDPYVGALILAKQALYIARNS